MKAQLKVFNTFTKKLEPFEAIDGNNVKIYICGPTVYDSPHIGHARTYVMFDVIRNILQKYYSYNVTYVMNITDIDDKIIKRANENKTDTSFVTEKYTKEFFDDMEALNVKKPDYVTKVTDYVEKIVDFVKVLVDNKSAYEKNGSVYFEIDNYKQLFKYPIFKNEVGIDLEGVGITEKKSNVDFALWKAAKEGEPSYDSIWGPGRPGWHIECSVMASDVLGRDIDIHAGGIDLTFPHHENEIAQCQAYYNQKWIKYFLHTGHLNINGLKMSKSLKNFTTIKDILKEVSPVQLRILFLHHQWNKDMNYELSELKFAQSVEKKIKNFLALCNAVNNLEFKNMMDKDFEVLAEINKSSYAIDMAFSNNFDTATPLKIILELISFVNVRIKELSKQTLLKSRDFVSNILDILGIVFEGKNENDDDMGSILTALGSFRDSVRNVAKQSKSKELFNICDNVRKELKEKGFAIEDGSDGASIIKKIN